MKTSRALAPLALIFLLLPPGCASASSDSSSPDGRDGEDDAATSASSSSSSSSGAPTSSVGSNALLAEAQMIVRTMKSTAYQHTSNIDAMKGIYDVDCSGFVDYAMSKSAPDAYAALVEATVPRPVAESYVAFMASLTASNRSWSNVHLVKDLAPGDLVAWKIPAGVKSSDTGHLMIVEKAPVIVGNQAQIAIIDSTENGHGDIDPRVPKGPTGIGRGTTVVMTNADGTASGYRWSTDSDSPPYTTEVVMAHLD